jgi:membrane-bound metal-dependent hydrolase YbcI (DUF457 family)
MLGRNHGMLGIAGFGASVWYGEHSLHLHALVLPDLAMGMAVAAGAALAPDLDEHQSLGGRANPISDLPIFGGHRTRTHTLLAAAVVLGLALLCQRDRTAMAVFVGFMARTGGSVALATVRRAGCFLSVPLGALAGYVSHSYLSAGWWLTAAVALPYLSHLMADAVTVGGVPLLMPFTKHRFSLGLIKTWHLTERVIFTPLILATASVATWGALGPSIGALRVPGLPRLLS